ncbi:uncharacterized protein LOC135490704 [Lineus longissimus]|uniref:uncharacterized protein LOC135490704 n=1 Tax=Lineus longissimus TaxID=88925 RepID=UPI002B4D5148
MSLKYTEADVDELNDLLSAMSLCDDNGIDFGDLETLGEFKKLLKDRKRACGKDDRTKKQDRFRQITQADAEQRRQLGEVYSALLEFFKLEGCDEKVEENINNQIRNCKEQIVEHDFKLRNDGCPILVTGETGAGKSSFLNLLLGSDILPVDHALSATSTICELHNSEKTEAEIYYGEKHPNKKEDKNFETVTLPRDDLPEVQKKLKEFANIEDREKDVNKFDLIRIHWPIPMLQGNVYLVDSPGVGESKEMNKKVLQYLPKAAAFIYIVNSSVNGGGISENRIELILKQITSNTSEGQLQVFNPQSAIFIFNKWDEVPDASKEELKKRNIEKLKKMWSGLDEKKQIYYLSVKQARRLLQMEAGETDDYKLLLDSIYGFMEMGLNICIRNHQRWLEYVHGRITNTIQTRVTNAKRSNEERLKIANHIKHKLSRLLNESKKIIEDLQELLEKKTVKIVTKLAENLRLKKTMERIARHCCEQEIPDEEDMEKNRFICKDLIREALFKEVADWESEHRIFETTKKNLFGAFRKKFAHVENELQRIERLMQGAGSLPQTSASGGLMEDVPEDGALFSAAEKLVLGLTSPIWLPLAIIASAIALPIMGSLAIRDKIQHDRKLLAYRKDKYKYVFQWTKQVIDALKDEDIKKTFVENQLSGLSDYIMKFESIIPELVEADKKLIEDVEGDITATKDILKKYSPLLEQVNTSHGFLQLFRFRNLLSDDPDVFSEADIERKHIIGTGSFADVWVVNLKRDEGQVEKVAAKVMKVELTADNAMDYALERETLINLQDENIIRYIGTILDSNQRLTLLLELCKCTLADIVYTQREKNPGHQTDPEKRSVAFEFIADVSQQIAKGLLYIHRKSYIHRDLKTDNVLLTDNGVVKLSDLGQAKRERDVTGTQRGTYLYTDPDILQTGLATREADIYSLAMVMWELWYGQRVFFDLLDAGMSWIELEGKIQKDDYRPTFTIKGCVPPSQDWQNLIESCWCAKPKDRKNTKQVYDELCKWSKREYVLQMVVEAEVDEPLPNDGQVMMPNEEESFYSSYVRQLRLVNSIDCTLDSRSGEESSPGPIMREIKYERVVDEEEIAEV